MITPLARRPGQVTLEIPLTGARLASLTIPEDFNEHDAKRLIEILTALAWKAPREWIDS